MSTLSLIFENIKGLIWYVFPNLIHLQYIVMVNSLVK